MNGEYSENELNLPGGIRVHASVIPPDDYEACLGEDKLIVAKYDFVGVRPGPKGSLRPMVRHTRTGPRVHMVEQSKRGVDYRKHLAAVIRATWPNAPIDVPIMVSGTFWIPRPAKASKIPYADLFPILRSGANAGGDIDKLTRATFDAMQDGGLIADDALVVSSNFSKLYSDHVQGAVFRVSLVLGQDLEAGL